MTMSTDILCSLLLPGDVSQDTSGSPLEGGEMVPANTPRTTTKPTHQYPLRLTKANEIDLRSYLPVHICLVFEISLDLYLVFHRIIHYTSCRTVALFLPSPMLSFTSHTGSLVVLLYSPPTSPFIVMFFTLFRLVTCSFIVIGNAHAPLEYHTTRDNAPGTRPESNLEFREGPALLELHASIIG